MSIGTEFTTERLLGAVAPGKDRQADKIRKAFWEGHKPRPRAIAGILVLRNSDNRYSVRNPATGSVYDVLPATSYQGGTRYEFLCVGYDPFQ